MKRFVKAFEAALHTYEIEGWVAQTDLKPLTVLAVDNLLPAKRGDLTLWANSMRTNDYRVRVVDKQLQRATHRDFEVLVDVNVLKGRRDPFETLITAESEGYSAHGNALASLENDFAWDLYKLLVVPSPVKLFVARTSTRHHDLLEKQTEELVAHYRGAGDWEFCAVLFPTGRLDRHPIRFMHLDRGAVAHASKVGCLVRGHALERTT